MCHGSGIECHRGSEYKAFISGQGNICGGYEIQARLCWGRGDMFSTVGYKETGRIESMDHFGWRINFI